MMQMFQSTSSKFLPILALMQLLRQIQTIRCEKKKKEKNPTKICNMWEIDFFLMDTYVSVMYYSNINCFKYM